ncbi:hypothetical protein PLESTB_000201600 [Pleodorina starrii]|uniref:Uncharacterized protein n=1 Tax=Pleodorina starrii TaxID=330485 RepID=A0A9W6BBW3_9CHLO|nr:hypothetical protein PLESTM_000330100 [Pleodorina starrii]GLC49277.1 hypothetical protein PLESTB_000201600 [Pleodorina starrii]GLC73468.1 hypothetical protein PLESTF_001381200 [Pleodorina starrii]
MPCCGASGSGGIDGTGGFVLATAMRHNNCDASQASAAGGGAAAGDGGGGDHADPQLRAAGAPATAKGGFGAWPAAATAAVAPSPPAQYGGVPFEKEEAANQWLVFGHENDMEALGCMLI